MPSELNIALDRWRRCEELLRRVMCSVNFLTEGFRRGNDQWIERFNLCSLFMRECMCVHHRWRTIKCSWRLERTYLNRQTVIFIQQLGERQWPNQRWRLLNLQATTGGSKTLLKTSDETPRQAGISLSDTTSIDPTPFFFKHWTSSSPLQRMLARSDHTTRVEIAQKLTTFTERVRRVTILALAWKMLVRRLAFSVRFLTRRRGEWKIRLARERSGAA